MYGSVALVACELAVEEPDGGKKLPLSEPEADGCDEELGAGTVVVGVVLVAGLVVVVPVSGSTYWLSPADVLVPDASALALTSRASATSAVRQARIWSSRATAEVFKQWGRP